MQLISEWMALKYYHNSILSWLTALGVALILTLVLKLLRDVAGRKLKSFSSMTSNQIDDLAASVIMRTRLIVLLVVALSLASQFLVLGSKGEHWMDGLLVVAVLVQVIIWGNAGIAYLIRRYAQLEPEQQGSAAALNFLLRLAFVAIVLLVGLDNLGVDVTTLVTSMGIGGIAIALAAQNILGDLFGSLSILFDKPFVVGDFIVVDDKAGTVEKIGMKTTRVRSLHGEQLIFSNSDLLTSRIKNYKRMYERRVTFLFGVTYETPVQQLENIPLTVRSIIDSEENVRFERAHFKEYGDFALNFEVVYWVRSPDYGLYMDIQQRINLELFRRFETEGIDFAYPTQTLYLARAAKQANSSTEKDAS